MGKNVLFLKAFLAMFLFVGAAHAEQVADDMWIVEPGAGRKLKEVMQETVDGTNNLANREVKITDTKGLQDMALAAEEKATQTEEEIKNAATNNVDAVKTDAEAVISEDVKAIDEIAKKAKEQGSNIVTLNNKTYEVVPLEHAVVIKSAMPQANAEPEIVEGHKIIRNGAVAPEFAPELKGQKQILKDKIHNQTYMVQSVETKANRKAREEAENARPAPVQLIKVPDEVRAREVWYDEFEDMTVRAETPRSFNYPIGDERRERNEDLRAAFDPMLRMAEVKEGDNPEHRDAVAHYKQEVLQCTRVRSEKTALETDLLEYDGRMYDNAAFLSNTLAETESCLRELGYEIVEVMYLNDPEVLMDYDEHVEKLHVDSTSVDFKPKFCGENCSLRAVVDAQRTRIAEFQKYLCQLLNESPKDALQAHDVLKPEDLDDMPYFDEEANYYTPELVTKPAQPRMVRNEPEVVRRRIATPPVHASKRVVNPVQQKAVYLGKAPQPQPRRVIEQQNAVRQQQQRAAEEIKYYEGMEIPMIDESEL